MFLLFYSSLNLFPFVFCSCFVLLTIFWTFTEVREGFCSFPATSHGSWSSVKTNDGHRRISNKKPQHRENSAGTLTLQRPQVVILTARYQILLSTIKKILSVERNAFNVLGNLKKKKKKEQKTPKPWGGRENAHLHQKCIIQICSRLKTASLKETYDCSRHSTFGRDTVSCPANKMQLPLSV